jgi:hypothetical protein
MPNNTDDIEPNVRSSSYSIIRSRMRCPQCNALTAVFTFALPAGYESRSVDDDTPDDEFGPWETQETAAVLSYIEYLSDAVANRIRAMTPHYRLGLDSQSNETWWRNHCEHCEAQMEEEELLEFDGPFGMMPTEGLEAIQVRRFREPFEGWAGGESHDLKPLDS